MNVEKTIFNDVTIFVQLQDSRVFGQEKGTLTDIRNIDLHQGWVKIKNLFELPLSLQVGRFKLIYGGYKIFGPNDWHNVGRSYDGLRFSLEGSFYQLDGFLTVYNNFLNYRAGAADNLQNYNYINPPADTGFNIYGIYSMFKLNENNKLDIYAYYEWDRSLPNGRNKNMERATLGSRYNLSINSIDFILEAAYQTGRLYYKPLNKSMDISSFMVFSTIGYSSQDFQISLNADISSGGNPSKQDNYRLFDNPYSTKHNFQGYMDFFTKLSDPSFITGVFGLQDYFLKLNYKPKDSKFSAELNGHYFLPFERISLENTGNSKYNDASNYGTEIDFVLFYDLFKTVKLEWGSGLFIPDNGMKLLYSTLLQRGTVDKFDPAFWTYLQFNILF